MNMLLIVPHYIAWHYSRGITSYLGRWRDFLWFGWNFFSIGILFKTLLTPFERLGEKSKKFDPEKMLEALATTLIMRVVGLVVRSFFIALGLLSLLAMIIFGALGFLLWLSLPFVLLAMLITGVIAFFS